MATATSATIATIAPDLAGCWVHAVADPAGSQGNYLYQSAMRAESIEVDATALKFIGRRYPVFEFGDSEASTLRLSIKVPIDAAHDAAVAAWRAYERGRRLLCYRDNRGRVLFGVIVGGLALSDVRDGTTIVLTLQNADYVEGL